MLAGLSQSFSCWAD